MKENKFSTVTTLGKTYLLLQETKFTDSINEQKAEKLLQESAKSPAGLITVRNINRDENFKNQIAPGPEAVWSMRLFTESGEQLHKSGTAIPAAVRYLVDSGLYNPRDRRETISILTKGGVVDTLLGVSGISVDMGRWQFHSEQVGATPGLSLTLGREISTALIDSEEPFPNKQDTSFSANVLVKVGSNMNSDGFGSVHTTSYDSNGKVLSSGTGAIAAALTARHYATGKTLNHWRVETTGGTLAVRMFPTEDGEHVSLSCPVEITGEESLMV